MIGRNDKISNIQMMILIVSTVIGVGILSLPAGLADRLGNDGWLLIIINGLIAALITFVITTIMKNFKGKTLMDFSKELVTSPVTFIILIIFFIYFIGFSAFVVRIFGEVVKMFLLEHTPIEVIILTMLLTTSYLARTGVEGMARMSMFIFPIVIVPLIFLMILLIAEINYENLLPSFQFGLMDLIRAIPATFFSFIGFEFLFIYMGFVDKPKKSLKYNLVAIVIIAVLYLLVFIISLAQFSLVELKHQLWPTLTLMKTIEFPGTFIENVDAVAMAIWILAVLTTLAPTIYGASFVLSKLVKAKEQNYFVLPIVPLIYFVSLIPGNLAEVYSFLDIFTYYFGTFVAIVVPVVFLIAVLIRKKNKKEATGNE